MRLVFLFFLLMNVIFFAWQYTQPKSGDHALPAIDSSIPKLMLAEEGSLEVAEKSPEPMILHVMEKQEKLVEAIIMQPNESRPEKSKSAKSKTKTPIIRTDRNKLCYAIGIFKEKTKANAIKAGLKKTGRPAKTKAFRGVTNLYWVYLPAFATAAEASHVANDLKNRGLTDYQILAINGKDNSISLGIFRFRSTANLRVKHLNRLGYEPKIEIRKRKTRQYKVIYPVKSAKPLSSSEWRTIQTKHPDLVMREEPCK